MTALLASAVIALALTECASSTLLPEPAQPSPLERRAGAADPGQARSPILPTLPPTPGELATAISVSGPLPAQPRGSTPSMPVASAPAPTPAPTPAPAPGAVPSAAAADVTADPPAPVHCASAPALLPDGSVPPAPPHIPLGADVIVTDDRPAYVLPGDPGDPRVIIYLHGMCGDATAADYFREAVRAHGTLIALRGDTPCDNGRFKWRDDPVKIQARIRTAFSRVNALRNGELLLDQALLFGYSQGAERAERLAAQFPAQYPRLVLGGPPTKASPRRLARAKRVAILGGELETTETMRAGFDALAGAGIASRFFTLECAYHGYFGANPESQLGEVLDWVSGL